VTWCSRNQKSDGAQETKNNSGGGEKSQKKAKKEEVVEPVPLEREDSPYIPTSPSDDGREPYLPPTPTYVPPEDPPPPIPPSWMLPQKSVKVLTTQQMPSLLSIEPDSIRAYEANVRAWRATSQAEIRRDTWPRDVQARIEVDWIDSNEATKFGEEWRDNKAVSEEVFLLLDQTLRARKVKREWNEPLSGEGSACDVRGILRETSEDRTTRSGNIHPAIC
jgi:hypothetical protein